MKEYPVKVECLQKKHKRYWWKMRRCGLYWNGENGFEGHITQKKINKLSIYCQRNRLRYYIDNNFGKRSSDYRKRFFEENEPVFGSCYICAYCGWPVQKDKLTVDHLYPVSVARKSVQLQKRLNRKGIHDINDVKNLVPSCRSCNSSKGAKMGIWILRGKIGRYPKIWLFRHSIRLIVLIGIVVYFYKMGYLEETWKYMQTMWEIIFHD